MSNNFYNQSGYPAYGADGDSQSARSEFAAIQSGFDKMPTLTASGLYMVRVNAAATALESVPLIASLVGNTASGSIAATTGQAVIAELGARTIDGQAWSAGGINLLVVAPAIHAAPSKSTPVDADEIGIWNSVGGVLGKLTWANLKATLTASNIFTSKTSATGSAVLPASTTAGRDVSPAVGYLRYNTSLNQFEGYGSSGWGKVGGGTSGAGTDAAVYENDATITQSYTIGQGTLISGATITIASPAVVTLTSHGFVAGSQVFFQTTGALPTGLSVDYGYWVISTGLTADSFQLSLTEGGAAINTSGTQSGVHSCGKLKNATSAGTVTVISGATITVPTNATWTVV